MPAPRHDGDGNDRDHPQSIGDDDNNDNHTDLDHVPDANTTNANNDNEENYDHDDNDDTDTNLNLANDPEVINVYSRENAEELLAGAGALEDALLSGTWRVMNILGRVYYYPMVVMV